MDATDLAIVRVLLKDPLSRPADVARRVQLGDSATRARIRRLQSTGTIGPPSVIPNARLLGKHYVVALYRDLDWQETLQAPTVVGSSINHEGVVAPTCLVDTHVPEALIALYGQPERTFVQADAPLNPPGTALSDLQWRIMCAFVAKPTATDQDLAATTGLSPRTVARHRQAFIQGGHVRVEPNIRSLRGDHVLFHLYVQGPGSHSPAVRQALENRLGGVWAQHRLADPQGVLYFCTAPNLADAAAAPALATSLQGVDHAELVISVDGAYSTDRLVQACQSARSNQKATAPRD